MPVHYSHILLYSNTMKMLEPWCDVLFVRTGQDQIFILRRPELCGYAHNTRVIIGKYKKALNESGERLYA